MPGRFGRRPLRRSVIACCALGVVAFALAGPALAATTVRVDDDHAQCPSAAFSTISAAIAVVAPGDRVAVCPGTYAEQIRIGKPGLQVVAAAGFAGGVFIRPPDPMSRPAAIVTLSAPATMLRGVTVLGPGPASLGPCAPDYAGVLVDSPAAELTEAPVLARDRVLDIVSRGCRTPFFPGAFANPSFPGETGNALVLDSSAVVRTTRIQRPGEEGIVVAGTDTHALLSHVFARGRAPFFNQPQSLTGIANGIDILDPGAVVTIRDSQVRDFTFQLSPDAESPNIEYGVKANPGTSLRLVRSIIENDTVGVGLLGTNGAFVTDNSIHGNDINILATAEASRNRVLRNLVAGALGPSTGSVLAEADCKDDSHGSGTAATANLWQDNVGGGGAESFPPEICPPPPSSS